MRLPMASMGCRSKRRNPRAAQGQATVEFAVVLFGFLALLAALGALADFGQSGALVEHAAAGASHAVGSNDTGAWADVLAY